MRQRLPREERMRGYRDVEIRHADHFFGAFSDAVPVAREICHTTAQSTLKYLCTARLRNARIWRQGPRHRARHAAYRTCASART
jgi:hypothetical protein